MAERIAGGPFDVAIIGAGVVGCAAARRFALAGARVIVIEKGADIRSPPPRPTAQFCTPASTHRPTASNGRWCAPAAKNISPCERPIRSGRVK